MIGQDISHCYSLLSEGKLVAIPTETVYGLAANALNADAVLNIFETKNRPVFDPLILHAGTLDNILLHVTEFPEKARKLAMTFWPGPLTLVLPRKHHIPDIVCSGLPHVAVRIPDHPLTLELLKQLPFPIAAPSANPFGYISPTTAQHVEDQLGSRIPYILDGGPCRVGIESTIVSFHQSRPVILRLGGLSPEAIEDVIGKVDVALHQNSNPSVPGQLDAHYAPHKRLIFGDLDRLIPQFSSSKIAVLSYKEEYSSPAIVESFRLSASGDLHEAANRLFLGMRLLDHSPADIILAEPVPTHGLGAAINDRLQRAAFH